MRLSGSLRVKKKVELGGAEKYSLGCAAQPSRCEYLKKQAAPCVGG